jgi:hypothetical protein
MGKVSKCSLIILAIISIIGNPFITLTLILVMSCGCCGFSEQQQMKVLKYCMVFILVLECIICAFYIIIGVAVIDLAVCDYTSGGTGGRRFLQSGQCLDDDQALRNAPIIWTGSPPQTCAQLANGGGCCSLENVARDNPGDIQQDMCCASCGPDCTAAAADALGTLGIEQGKAMCGDNGVQALFWEAYIVRDNVCMSSPFLELLNLNLTAARRNSSCWTFSFCNSSGRTWSAPLGCSASSMANSTGKERNPWNSKRQEGSKGAKRTLSPSD